MQRLLICKHDSMPFEADSVTYQLMWQQPTSDHADEAMFLQCHLQEVETHDGLRQQKVDCL